MRIQHNISALNAHRQLGSNQSAIGKNLEKLSSGYKINRAGDDAAGLAISEKMRSQIKGLETAQKNANDGISLVQTAEGALTEVHSMLNRMTELATQSANGTYDDKTDRANLQKEVQALKSEIDRISDSTNYNGINLLDGSIGGGTGAATKSVKITNATTAETTAAAGKYAVAAQDSVIANNEKDGSSVNYTITYKDNADGANKTLDIKLSLSTKDDGTKVLLSNTGKEHAIAGFAANGVKDTEIAAAIKSELANSPLADKFKITEAGRAFTFEAREKGSAGAVITGVSQRTTNSAGTTADASKAITVTSAKDEYKTLTATGVTSFDGTNADKAIFNINGNKFVLAATDTDVSRLDKNVTVLTGTAFTADHAFQISQKTGLNVTAGTGADEGTLTFKPGAGVAGSGGLDLQIGDTTDSFNKLSVSVGSMSTKALNIASIDISSQDGAAASVSIIKDAINSVSSTRGDLGAIQNRLEHTINNLGVTAENMTAAESRIRDVDMAKEMMEFTKNNILSQAATSMLAQANQSPQGVLQLLQ